MCLPTAVATIILICMQDFFCKIYHQFFLSIGSYIIKPDIINLHFSSLPTWNSEIVDFSLFSYHMFLLGQAPPYEVNSEICVLA